jgi:hypothetical protein
MTFRLVVIESPYSSSNGYPIETNVQYARAAMRDCLHRGEAPYASHLLYTQPNVLRDEVPADRELGMAAGFAWGAKADCVVVYTDLGVTAGMTMGIEKAQARGIKIEYRTIARGSW